MKIRTEYICPLELVHDMIKGKWNGTYLRGKGCYPGLTPTKKWVIYYSKLAAYNISIKLIGGIEHECNKQRNY